MVFSEAFLFANPQLEKKYLEETKMSQSRAHVNKSAFCLR